MRVVIAEGTKQEVEGFYERFGFAGVGKVGTAQEQDRDSAKAKMQPVSPVKSPVKQQLVKRRRKVANSRRSWSEEDWNRAKEFYKNPANHYRTGEIIWSKLRRFAKRIGRTPMAVRIRFNEQGLIKHQVIGRRVRRVDRRIGRHLSEEHKQHIRETLLRKRLQKEGIEAEEQRYEKQKSAGSGKGGWSKGRKLSEEHKRRISEGMRRAMRQRRAGKKAAAASAAAKKRSPVDQALQQITSVKDKKLLQDALLQAVDAKQPISFAAGQYLFGIGTPAEWAIFTLEFGLHAGEIARAMQLKGHFELHLDASGAGRILYV